MSVLNDKEFSKENKVDFNKEQKANLYTQYKLAVTADLTSTFILKIDQSIKIKFLNNF